MYDNKKVLKSKLRFSGASETIIRDRLMPMMSDISQKRLSMVVAGAGYGKTTLVKQAISNFNLPAVWYRLDKYDSDFATFFRYLKTGIEEHLGKIEIPAEEELQYTNKIEEVLNIFLEEVENRIQHQLIIVLDDYYLVHDSEDVNRAIEFFIENMHHKIHLVLISRSEPPIKISIMRVRREVLDLTESDLAFTVSEIKKLYLDLFHLSLQSETIAGLQEKTGGWAAALILFFHSLRGKSQETADNDLLKIQGSHQIISSYLEENIYEVLPPATKDFLVKTSLLSKVKVAFCNQLLGITNSKKILSDLEKSHLLTFQLDEEEDCYTYHHIFQNFLRTKIDSNNSREEIQEIQLQIARLLEQEGDEEEALEYFLESEQMEDSVRIIGKISNMLWVKGRHQRLESYLNRIPAKYLQQEPWIKYLKVQWLDMNGQIQEAMQCLEQSHEAFLKDKEPYGAALCLLRLGFYYLIDGDSAKAEKTYQTAIDISTDNIELTMILYTFSIDSLSQQGKFEQADQCYNKVIASLANMQDGEWRLALAAAVYLQMGNRYLLSGNFVKSLDFLEKARQLIENKDFYTLQIIYCFQISLVNYCMGYFVESLEHAEKGLELMSEKGLVGSFPSAWLHNFVSMNCFELEQPIKAMEHIQKSQQMFENSGNSWGRGACYLIFFHIYRHLGDDMEAMKSLLQCETVIGQLKIPWIESKLKTSKAEWYIQNNDFHKAQQLLTTAEKDFKPFKSLRSRLDFVWARYFWMQNKKEKAFEKLLKGIKAYRENQYYFFTSVDNEVIIHMMVTLFASEKEQFYIKKIFSQWGMRSRPALIDLYQSGSAEISSAALELLKQIPAPALLISCLGEFKLFRGDEEVPAESWTNKKAKLLLKFLLIERSRGFIPKDVLIEMLWPDQDIKTTTNRLWVTLSALRKTLEPGLIKGMTSSYVLNDVDGYKLYIGDAGKSDIDEFIDEIKLAKENEKSPGKSILHYLKAESIYKGEFLTEDLYVDWITEKRDNYRELYLNAIGRIIDYYESRKDFLKCTEYAKKYLEVDRYAENIYQRLMTYYSYTGNMAMITLTYENCKQNIVEDLCSSLSQKTESLYEELIMEQ